MGLLQQKCGPEWHIRGYVFAINVNSGWFKSFPVEQNAVLYQQAMINANTLAEALKESKEPEAKEELFCSSCPFKGNCPKLQEGAVELPKELGEVAKKVKSLSKTEKQIKDLKNQLKEWFEGTNIQKGKVDDWTLSLVRVKGKEMADTKALKEKYPDIWNEVKTTSKPYSWVRIV